MTVLLLLFDLRIGSTKYVGSPWIDACRLSASELSSRSEDSEQSDRRLKFEMPLDGGRSSRSPVHQVLHRSAASRPSVGVPYSVTCPSRFDGFLLDGPGQSQLAAAQIPRPSASGEPVVTAAVRSAGHRACDICGPQSRQTSSVFEISSYIIANSAASNASVQPCAIADV